MTGRLTGEEERKESERKEWKRASEVNRTATADLM
jgi:hypothetical protein